MNIWLDVIKLFEIKIFLKSYYNFPSLSHAGYLLYNQNSCAQILSNALILPNKFEPSIIVTYQGKVKIT